MIIRPAALVAEDEPFLRIAIAEMLEDAGFEVHQASNAAEALQQLLSHPTVVLLLTDVQMPGEMDGFALAREVAKRSPAVAVVVCSGHMQPRPSDLPPGAHFVAKPFSMEAITLALRRFDLP